MGDLHVMVRDELDRAFRAAVIQEYGSKKGSLGKAVEEALSLWLKEKGYEVKKLDSDD